MPSFPTNDSNGAILGKVGDWLRATFSGASDHAYSPLRYGAAGNGTTDDRLALNATLTAAPAGAVVDLGGRTYNVGTGITFSKSVTVRNGTLSAVDNRVALVNAPGCHFDKVEFRRTGTARSGSFDSAVTVNAENARFIDVTAITTRGDALHLGNGTCNGIIVQRGRYETSDPNSYYAIQLRSGGTHNYDIRVMHATIRHQGYGTGIGLYNCSRSTAAYNDVRGIRSSPIFTATGWTLVSGTVYRALDRTDVESNAVYVNGTEYRKNSPSDSTAPALNFYTVPGDGYIYINTGVDPSTQVVTTARTNGYGILFYATSSETLGMSDNLIAHNYIEDTDGFGWYWQNLQNVARNNKAIQNTLRNVCKRGTVVADLPFGGIGVFGGVGLQIIGDTVDGAGSVETPCPGINFKASVGAPHMTVTLDAVRVSNASGNGIQIAPGSWHLNNVIVENCAGKGITHGTSIAGDLFDVDVHGAKVLNNTGDGLYFETTTTAELRVRVLGGRYSGNLRNLTFARCRDVYIGGGLLSELATSYGVSLTGTNIRVMIDGVFFRAGQGLSIAAGIADLTIGNVTNDGSSGTKFNVTGPYKVAGATGSGAEWRCTGTPEGQIAAPVGSTARRTDGAAGATFYVKETGTGNTGWVAK